MELLFHGLGGVLLAAMVFYLCLDSSGPAEYVPPGATQAQQYEQFNGTLPAVLMMKNAPYSDLPHATLWKVFTPEECEGIIKHMLERKEGFQQNEFRSSSQKYLAEDLQWVYERMERKVKELNRDIFQVDNLNVKRTGPDQEAIQFAQYHQDKRGDLSSTILPACGEHVCIQNANYPPHPTTTTFCLGK